MGLLNKILARSGAQDPRRDAAAEWRHWVEGSPFGGIVLELPDGAPPGPAGIAEPLLDQVTRMVASVGAAAPLPGGRCLVLLPGDRDDDLIAHRLCASLDARALAVFRAAQVDAALLELRPFL